MAVQVTHPDYSGGIFPPGQGDRCVCGGVRYWHASPPYGCDDCKECAAFDAAPLGPTEAQVRARVAAEIEARQIICPIHHMSDCSPLLTGCSLPIHLHEQRVIDARIARGESS